MGYSKVSYSRIGGCRKIAPFNTQIHPTGSSGEWKFRRDFKQFTLDVVTTASWRLFPICHNFFPEEQGTGLCPDEVFRLLLLAAARVSVSVDRVKLGLLTSLRAMEDTFVRIPSSVMLEG